MWRCWSVCPVSCQIIKDKMAWRIVSIRWIPIADVVISTTVGLGPKEIADILLESLQISLSLSCFVWVFFCPRYSLLKSPPFNTMNINKESYKSTIILSRLPTHIILIPFSFWFTYWNINFTILLLLFHATFANFKHIICISLNITWLYKNDAQNV